MTTQMFQVLPGILAAVGDGGWQDSAVVVLTIAIMLGAAMGVILWRDRQRSGQIGMLQDAHRRSQAQTDVHAERDQKAYAQHVALNDLTAEKIKLENQYLQLQVKIGQLEIDARERNEDYHRLMSQKTQLEIQSLKLHIREQTKRLDDFSGYDEE